jgi:small subunit ribosomal protein S17
MADENVNDETNDDETTSEDLPAVDEAADQVEEPTAEAAGEPVEAPAPESEPADEQPVEAEEGAPAAPAAAADSSSASATAEAPRKRKRLPRSQRRQRTKPKREQPAERRPIVRLPKPERERGRTQERQGTVVSDAMDKTIVVKVDVIKAHRKYKKVVRRSTKFHAHDESNQAKVGDVVRIVETRPLSKQKRWRLAEIVEVAK